MFIVICHFGLLGTIIIENLKLSHNTSGIKKTQTYFVLVYYLTFWLSSNLQVALRDISREEMTVMMPVKSLGPEPILTGARIGGAGI